MKGYFKYTTQLISSKLGGGIAFWYSASLPAHSILRLCIETAVYIRYVGEREREKKVSSVVTAAAAVNNNCKLKEAFDG